MHLSISLILFLLFLLLKHVLELNGPLSDNGLIVGIVSILIKFAIFLMPIFKEKNVSLRNSGILVSWMKILLTDLNFFILVVLSWVKNKSNPPSITKIPNKGFPNPIMQGGNYVLLHVHVKLVPFFP
jgi:hypothetical protein